MYGNEEQRIPLSPPVWGKKVRLKKRTAKQLNLRKATCFFSLQGFTRHISILRALIRPIVKKQIDFVHCFVILIRNSNSFQSYLMILFPLEYVFKH